MGLFTIFERETVYFKDKTGFIELESCPTGGIICTKPLSFINKKMHVSRTYWLNKDYQRAIEELKIAYHKTFEINQSDCQPCAVLFRSTIIKSLESIHEDLLKMTSGIFKADRFKPSLDMAISVLAEVRAGE